MTDQWMVPLRLISYKFNVSDRVKVVKHSSRWPNMDPFTGREGVIEGRSAFTGDLPCYRIQNMDGWWFEEDCLELVKSERCIRSLCGCNMRMEPMSTIPRDAKEALAVLPPGTLVKAKKAYIVTKQGLTYKVKESGIEALGTREESFFMTLQPINFNSAKPVDLWMLPKELDNHFEILQDLKPEETSSWIPQAEEPFRVIYGPYAGFVFLTQGAHYGDSDWVYTTQGKQFWRENIELPGPFRVGDHVTLEFPALLGQVFEITEMNGMIARVKGFGSVHVTVMKHAGKDAVLTTSPISKDEGLRPGDKNLGWKMKAFPNSVTLNMLSSAGPRMGKLVAQRNREQVAAKKWQEFGEHEKAVCQEWRLHAQALEAELHLEREHVLRLKLALSERSDPQPPASLVSRMVTRTGVELESLGALTLAVVGCLATVLLAPMRLLARGGKATGRYLLESYHDSIICDGGKRFNLAGLAVITAMGLTLAFGGVVVPWAVLKEDFQWKLEREAEQKTIPVYLSCDDPWGYLPTNPRSPAEQEWISIRAKRASGKIRWM